MATEIPGLFDSKSQSNHGLTSPMTANSGHQDGGSVSASDNRNVLEELMAEKGSLGPNFVHSNRLLDQEIAKVKSGGKDTGKAYYMMDGNIVQSEKVYIPFFLQKQHNLIGRLLGPKGMTLKGIQNETHTRMSILGRGSMKDRLKEEELRNSNEPAFVHLKDDLHVQVEAQPPMSHMKVAAGVAEIHKMLIPPVPGQPDTLLARYLDPQMIDDFPHPGGPPPGPGGHTPRGRGRGGLMPSPGGRGRGGPMRGGRGGNRGRGGRGGAIFDSPRGRGGGGRGGPGRFSEGSYGDRPTPSSAWKESKAEASRLPVEDFSRESREYEDRPFRDERRGGGDFGRASDPYSSLPSESEPYYSSFSDKPSRGSQYGRDSIPSSDYHHGSGSSEWKASRPARRDSGRYHPYGQGGGNYY